MKLPIRARTCIKNFLWISRAKIVYQRITLTRYTSFYFLFTVFLCLITSALHAVVVSDNTKAVTILDSVLLFSKLPPHITQIVDRVLQRCDGVPEGGAVCEIVVDLNEGSPALRRRKLEIYSRLMLRQVAPSGETGEDDKSSEGSSVDGDGTSSVSSNDSAEDLSASNTPTYASTPQAPAETILQPTLVTITNTPPVTTASGSPSASSPTASTAGPIQDTLNVPQRTESASRVTATSASAPTATSKGEQHSASPFPPNFPGETADSSIVSEECALSLSWLEDGLHDASREDIALLLSNLWMLTIGVFAESPWDIQHQDTGRINPGLDPKRISPTSRTVIVPRPCQGQDFLGKWWEESLAHAIPIVVLNGIGIIFLGFFTWKLYHVYSTQTFSRVGASPIVHRMYKVLLLFSAGLHLSMFFSIVSAGLWISKMTHGNIREFAHHRHTYTAVFAVFILAIIPWVIMGWVSVRKEARKRFWVFVGMSVLLVSFSSFMFSSAFGLLCRINFGKGLSGFLDVSEALEGADFTPVNFSHYNEKRDGESGTWGASQRNDILRSVSRTDIAIPEKIHQDGTGPLPQDNPFIAAQEIERDVVYSDNLRDPVRVHLSSEPKLVSEKYQASMPPSRRSASQGNDGINAILNAAPASGDLNPSIASNSVMEYYMHPRAEVKDPDPWGHFSSKQGGEGRVSPMMESRPTSTLSQFLWHSQLAIMNPDAYRASVASSNASTIPPPVHIPTSARFSSANSSIRGIAAAFPTVPRPRSLEQV
ncbi:hypothetical protein FA15DRAFT_703125 [Coprinopsis marcescibilis]|uniref:Uncharacterized protein n=1 Tax=Coprinopsis marcescibilis TaxID=230819 RepID=A0A5C3KZM7_COPMA|nr:hypothetical protein FA15DRAFT_703125 [Coprinopsis marcescibilis]